MVKTQGPISIKCDICGGKVDIPKGFKEIGEYDLSISFGYNVDSGAYSPVDRSDDICSTCFTFIRKAVMTVIAIRKGTKVEDLGWMADKDLFSVLKLMEKVR